MSLPSSGSLSIKSAAGSGRSISQEVDGNETGSKSLSTLSASAGKSAPHSILEFYGYPAGPAAPGAVFGATRTSEPPNGILLQWNYGATGGTPDGVELTVSVNGGPDTFYTNVAYPATSYRVPHSELTYGNSYQYTIRAYNVTDYQPGSFVLSAVTYNAPAVPGAPSNVVATNTGSAIMVTWDAPTTGGPVEEYQIYRSVDGGVYNFLASTTATSFNNNALLPGHDYRYRIYASNDGGDSPYAESNIEPF